MTQHTTTMEIPDTIVGILGQRRISQWFKTRGDADIFELCTFKLGSILLLW